MTETAQLSNHTQIRKRVEEKMKESERLLKTVSPIQGNHPNKKVSISLKYSAYKLHCEDI